MALVLVVDDADTFRALILGSLVAQGHDVLEARDGREALDLLLAGALPDLIVLDLMMPVMDGNEFLKEARRLQGEIGLVVPPVLLCSAYLDRLGLDLGEPVRGGLPKPFGLSELRDKINEILGGRLREQPFGHGDTQGEGERPG